MTPKDKDKLIEFGRRLRQAREAKGMTQPELGNIIGTSKGMISQYEAGINDPRQSMIPLMADALNVSINWLLGVSDDMYDVQMAADTGLNLDSLSQESREKVIDYFRMLKTIEQRESENE